MRALLPLFLILSGATVLPAQQLVLPDNHYLCESPTQLASTGSTSWWGTTAGHFQVLYEASHFLGVSGGVTGPILITNIRFRGEDGEPNLGGQVYTGVVVQLGSTSLTNVTMTSTFATNRNPAPPETTTMGSAGTTNVTVQPSIGSTPNNWCIDIDLAAINAQFTFNPTGTEPNLLIDITMPTAPANALPLYLIPIQDTTGGALGVRGDSVFSTSPTNPTGTSTTAPPVVGIAFVGAGGFPALYPARNERYGAACGGACSTFYESFLNGQAFDLGAGLTLAPDDPTNPTYYVVVGGAAPVDLTQLNLTPDSTAANALVTHALGFTHKYPGGSTMSIKACTNGFVWLDTSMTSSISVCIDTQMLGVSANATARYMPFWIDLDAGRNTATNPNCGLHVKTDTSAGPGNAVCYVTWFQTSLARVGSGAGAGGHSVLTFQCAIHETTGFVEYRYGAMPAFIGNDTTSSAITFPAVVGFTRGRISSTPVIVGSMDPQSRDLSVEVPFSTDVEGTRGHMGQTVSATPDAGGAYYGGRVYPGQSMIYGATNVPPGAILGVQLLDVVASRPGLQLPGIISPNCRISVSANPVFGQIFVLPGSTVVGAPIPVVSGYQGSDMFVQFVVLDGLFNGGDLVTVASNAVRQTFGFR